MTTLKPVNPSHRRTQMQQMLTGGQVVPSFQCCAPCSDYMTFTQFHCYIPFVEYGVFVGWHEVYYSLDFYLWLDGGNIFTKVCKFCGFVFKYILGKDVGDDKIEKLIMESQNLEHFQRQNIPNFSDFNEMCLCGNVPISSIFVSELQCCPKCGRNLVLDANCKALQPNYAKRSYFKFQTHLEFS